MQKVHRNFQKFLPPPSFCVREYARLDQKCAALRYWGCSAPIANESLRMLIHDVLNFLMNGELLVRSEQGFIEIYYLFQLYFMYLSVTVRAFHGRGTIASSLFLL